MYLVYFEGMNEWMEACAPGCRSWGCISTLFQSFKNMF